MSHQKDIAVNIYLFKVNNGSTKKRYEIFPKLIIKIPEPSQWRRSGDFFCQL